jgi:adenylosuccinate synthase
LKKINLHLESTLFISKKAHLILPSHRILDAASEAHKGKTKIGSTLKGIGPTYMDKTGRNGLRVGDILNPNFIEKYNFLKQKHIDILKNYDFEYNISDYEKEWFEGIECIKSFQIIDSEIFINNLMLKNQTILAEGAQGTLLDIDFGTYPFVTSSNTVTAGACTGLGVAPNRIGEVFGIFKAYCTRVGSGPFPTELFDNDGDKLTEIGHEYGATTGRRRRCGWLDLPALKYSVMINGVTQLVMTKADVLQHFDIFKVAIAYFIENTVVESLPYDIGIPIKPIYMEFEGWKTDISKIKSEDEFPKELKIYIDFLEKSIGVPITIVSVGPNREETVFRKK